MENGAGLRSDEDAGALETERAQRVNGLEGEQSGDYATAHGGEPSSRAGSSD